MFVFLFPYWKNCCSILVLPWRLFYGDNWWNHAVSQLEKCIFIKCHLIYWKMLGWANAVTYSKQIDTGVSWSHLMVYFKSCICESWAMTQGFNFFFPFGEETKIKMIFYKCPILNLTILQRITAFLWNFKTNLVIY